MMKTEAEVKAMPKRFEDACNEDVMVDAEEAIHEVLLWVLGHREDDELAAHFEEI